MFEAAENTQSYNFLNEAKIKETIKAMTINSAITVILGCA